MALFEDPSWLKLEAVVSSATESLLLCAPFITRPGLERVQNQLADGVNVSVITGLSVEAWVAGVCDPEALLDFLHHCGTDQVSISTRLHAKAVVADASDALVGSANLTRRAYTHNLEIQASLDHAEVAQVTALIASWEDSIRVMSAGELAEWIAQHRDAVMDERRRIDEEHPWEPDALGDAQEDLDRLAGGRAIDRRPIHEPSLAVLEDFVDWLDDNHDLPGAAEVVARHDNRHGDNLTGHVKQSFFATYLLFRHDPELIADASQLLDGLGPGDIPQPEGDLLEAWVEHVHDNAGMQAESYSFPVLRGVLPPLLGGTRQGGGGGSSTLKRVLPLVARWLEDEE
jgi:hypothetical protein